MTVNINHPARLTIRNLKKTDKRTSEEKYLDNNIVPIYILSSNLLNCTCIACLFNLNMIFTLKKYQFLRYSIYIKKKRITLLWPRFVLH